MFHEFPIEVYDSDETKLNNEKNFVDSVARIKISEIESYYWSPIEKTTYIFMKSSKFYNVIMEFNDVVSIIENDGKLDAEKILCGCCDGRMYQVGLKNICEICGFEKELDK